MGERPGADGAVPGLLLLLHPGMEEQQEAVAALLGVPAAPRAAAALLQRSSAPCAVCCCRNATACCRPWRRSTAEHSRMHCMFAVVVAGVAHGRAVLPAVVGCSADAQNGWWESV